MKFYHTLYVNFFFFYSVVSRSTVLIMANRRQAEMLHRVGRCDMELVLAVRKMHLSSSQDSENTDFLPVFTVRYYSTQITTGT